MAQGTLNSSEAIRRQAEARVESIQARALPTDPEDVRRLVHELRVHQIELEMQNEELRETQQNLEASRDRYTQLYHQAPIGYMTVDHNGIVREANQTLAGMLGVPLDLICGHPFADFIAPEDRRIFFSRFKAFFNDPHGKHVELRLLHPSRDAFYSQIEGGWALFGENGGSATAQKKLLVIVHDISERKAWEDQLRKYEKMVTSANDFIALIDRRYVVQVLNRSYATAFGCGPDDIRGRPLSDLYGRKVFEKTLKPFLLKGLSGREVRFKAWFDLPHLDRRFLDSACYPIIESDGSVAGVVLIKRDYTRMKALEAQLVQSQKMEAVGTLAGGIAHDYNNLLMGIQGRASLMLYGLNKGHPHYDHLKSIEACVSNAASLTKQLLGFARGGKYEACVTDLNRLVRKQLDIFMPTRPEINTRTDLDSQIQPVTVDRNQIQQVLLNLILNACQAMPQGGELFVQTANVRLNKDHSQTYAVIPGPYVRLTIRDTGCGMDQITCRRIFEPFFTTKPMGKGTGMGLASVYGIVKNHAGYIDVSSTPDQGTTFVVYFPAA